MITQRICLVLGAGASAPYGFPTGGELLNDTRRLPDEWWPLVESVIPGTTKEGHEEFFQELDASGAESLDEFVGKRPQFKEYVTALIAYHIGQREGPGRIRGTRKELDWQNFLVRRLIDGPKLHELANFELSVVTFNFDRSFEEGLLVRLSATYREPGESDAEIRARVVSAISKWEIVHVHGSLGLLPEFAGQGESKPYAPTVDPDTLKRAMGRIILLNDAQPDSSEFGAARRLIRDASKVFFLGFGFHRLNCTRVLPTQSAWGQIQPTVYGTVKDMTAGRVEKAKSYFQPGPVPQLHDFDSLTLLQTYETTFSD